MLEPAEPCSSRQLLFLLPEPPTNHPVTRSLMAAPPQGSREGLQSGRLVAGFAAAQLPVAFHETLTFLPAPSLIDFVSTVSEIERERVKKATFFLPFLNKHKI